MTDAAFDPYEPRIQPVKAVGALIRFLKCKEATHEVFRLVATLDGPVAEKRFQEFARSRIGKKVLRQKLDLADALSDRGSLARLPDGSLGRAYLDFVIREGLSAEGFQAEMEASGETFRRAGEDRKRYTHRIRHTHDLLHVLTGYSRDFIGEMSLLAFTRQHIRSRALVAIIFFGCMKARRDYPGLPVWGCAREGARLGKAAGGLLFADWEMLLAMPLDSVRRELNIGVPRRYLSIQTGAETLDRRYRQALALNASAA